MWVIKVRIENVQGDPGRKRWAIEMLWLRFRFHRERAHLLNFSRVPDPRLKGDGGILTTSCGRESSLKLQYGAINKRKRHGTEKKTYLWIFKLSYLCSGLVCYVVAVWCPSSESNPLTDSLCLHVHKCACCFFSDFKVSWLLSKCSHRRRFAVS